MLITLVANTDGPVVKRGNGQLFTIDSVNHISSEWLECQGQALGTRTSQP
jgi:hypothetical protein